MSGPVELADLTDTDRPASAEPAGMLIDSRLAQVGSMQVRRALPNRARRTVGAWCFADHFGPAEVTDRMKPDIGPHPHTGLQTVTWLLEGELLHRDSLGSEQLIRPGQLNLMTAGCGVAHAEEATSSYRGAVHGVQLWVAQPAATRNGPPGFEHHLHLPQLEIDYCAITVLIGDLAGTASPARRDSDHIGADLDLRPGSSTLPLNPEFEYALIVTAGVVLARRLEVRPGHLFYLGTGRDELQLTTTESRRGLLLGGVPFPEQLLMWWNFVARTREEIDAAYDDWTAATDRFGRVESRLPRIETSRPMWRLPELASNADLRATSGTGRLTFKSS